MESDRSCGCAAGDASRNLLARQACRAVPHLLAELPAADISRRRHLDGAVCAGRQTVVYAAQLEGKPPELFTRVSTAPRRVRSASRARRSSPSPPPARWRSCFAPRIDLPFRAPHSDLSVDPIRLRGIARGSAARRRRAAGAPRGHVPRGLEPGRQVARASCANVGGKNRIEFPAGRVLFEDNAAIQSAISVSPSGDRVAFVFNRSISR